MSSYGVANCRTCWQTILEERRAEWAEVRIQLKALRIAKLNLAEIRNRSQPAPALPGEA